jgi:outer membrane protein TolC
MVKLRVFILIIAASFISFIFNAVIVKRACSSDILLTEEQQALSFDDFLKAAFESDSEFEEILIDELILKYQKSLKLPAKDLVLSVKQQHDFFYSQNRGEPNTSVSLSRLFPYTATDISVDYKVSSSSSSAGLKSEASFSISQPIASNAFGRSTRLLDKIVGLEVDVARYQVIEAYEDYLALVLTAYYSWIEDYQNLNIGQRSYSSNLKLLEDIYERESEKIAYPIDINKVKLQVMAKEERLIELKEQYKKSLNIIKRIIRYQESPELIPLLPESRDNIDPDFQSSFESFQRESRTFDILEKLKKKSKLELARDADLLLPSISLLIGYETKGDNHALDNRDNLFYGGLKLDWPFGNQVQRSEYEISKILERRSRLTAENTYQRLYTQLLNLYLQLEKEERLIEIADQRINLAEAILEDERENYSFGRVTLNDYIQAVNNLDSNRFNKVLHESLYRKLTVEWLRLTDRLVQPKDIDIRLEGLEKSK